ncbi:aminotransferase [Clostridia bacterium]|nr:aminotransferase [Clostridia bacterium]
MTYKFAERISTLRPSAIREILKHTQNPGIIPFAAGNPAPEAFGTAEIGEILRDIMESEPVAALQYSVTEGYAPLREQVYARLRQKRVVCGSDSVLITCGAQQVMDITAKLLLPEGGVVICENPTFIGSLSAFRSYGGVCAGVPFDDEGIDLYGVESALADGLHDRRVGFVYVIPNFQNPTGRVMSLQRRRDLLSLCVRYGTPVLEDDPYGELRFAGESLPSIREIAVSRGQSEFVIYAGSFSKILAPGLRVGYMAANELFAARAVAAMQSSTVHTTILSQLTAYRFFEKYDYDTHTERLRGIYRRKCGIMRDALGECRHISTDGAEGGLFLYLQLPFEAENFVKTALERKVAIVPADAFAADVMFDGKSASDVLSHAVRLNYSTPSDEQILRGCEVMRDILSEM